jgi:hypothetical protein
LTDYHETYCEHHASIFSSLYLLTHLKDILNFLTLSPERCWIRDEVASIKTKDMIMCCLIRAVAYLRMQLYTSMEKWWSDDKWRKTKGT